MNPPGPDALLCMVQVADHEVSALLLAKAAEHGMLTAADERAIQAVRARSSTVQADEDIVRQGRRPDAAVFVLSGMLASYHTLPNGKRQYLSFHIKGDLPDVQSLFLSIMDHSLCALNKATIAILPHRELRNLFLQRPGVGFAFWRLTLVDAAIFRQSITNNSARSPMARLAHFFCEQHYRAKQVGLLEDGGCRLPLGQAQLGETLGMAHVSVNRTLQKLRKARVAELRGGKLEILNWKALTELAGFDPTYLHVAKLSDIAQSRFRGRS